MLLNQTYEPLRIKYQPKLGGSKDLFDAIFTGVQNEERVDYAVDSYAQISQCGYDEFDDLAGDEYTNTMRGYRVLTDYLNASVFNNSPSSYKIKLNEPVLKINTTSLTVTTTIGSYQADYVLSTTPLGFLKKNYATFLVPSIPQVKINAINAMGFGTVNKVFLVFDQSVNRPGFPKYDAFQVLWKKDLTWLDSKYSLKVFETFNYLIYNKKKI
jgi:hypothetical protein